MTAASRAPARLTIAADAGRLAEGRAFVRALAASVDADEETTSDLVQAVDELACNVIEHGYRHAPGEIELEGSVDGETIVVRLRDTAPPFDPRSVPAPRLDLPLAHRPFGGMGIHLARTLTDAMDHRILPGGGNEVTVTKRLRPVADGTAREGDDGHHDRATER
jgi:serine/threonine-protein kinase RsbW